MANTGLASSKNALFFAGGVIACAVIAAVTLGNQFTPQAEGAQSSELGAAAEQRPQADASDSGPNTGPDTAPESDSVFGEYEGFTEEADFIDDTSGFDTTPTDSITVTTDVTPSDGDQAAPQTQTSTRLPAQNGSQRSSRRTPSQLSERVRERARKRSKDINIIEQ